MLGEADIAVEAIVNLLLRTRRAVAGRRSVRIAGLRDIVRPQVAPWDHEEQDRPSRFRRPSSACLRRSCHEDQSGRANAVSQIIFQSSSKSSTGSICSGYRRPRAASSRSAADHAGDDPGHQRPAAAVWLRISGQIVEAMPTRHEQIAWRDSRLTRHKAISAIGNSFVSGPIRRPAGTGGVQPRIPPSAQPDQPEGHHGERREGQDEEDRRAAHRRGQTSCWPRKNEPVAMKKAKHIRHRCRADPLNGSEPRAQDRVEVEQAARAGRCRRRRRSAPGPAGVVDAGAAADQIISAAVTSAKRRRPISNQPVVPSRRRAATQEVATK